VPWRHGAHRKRVLVGGIAARIRAASRTNCETLERWRLATSRISSIPSRVKLMVVGITGIEKS
jgi:hypothetical protein